MKRKKKPVIKDLVLRKKLDLCDTIDVSASFYIQQKKRRPHKQTFQDNSSSKLKPLGY